MSTGCQAEGLILFGISGDLARKKLFSALYDLTEAGRLDMPVIGGDEMPFTYGELQAEMDLINRAYIEIMSAGDAKGRVFTFPIPTYNITADFPWDSPNARRLFAMTAKYGLPYFQNFLNSELKPNMIRSMCCRLQLDLRELLKRGNGLFGSAEQTVTRTLPEPCSSTGLPSANTCTLLT